MASCVKLLVYIALPYTKGDVAVNVRRGMDAWDEVWDTGRLIPFMPLYSHFQHMHRPRPYDAWMAYDEEVIKYCDCLLRYPGESSGAEREIEHAKALGIPVFYSLSALLDWMDLTYAPPSV